MLAINMEQGRTFESIRIIIINIKKERNGPNVVIIALVREKDEEIYTMQVVKREKERKGRKRKRQKRNLRRYLTRYRFNRDKRVPPATPVSNL